jgi:hypothetical protein
MCCRSIDKGAAGGERRMARLFYELGLLDWYVAVLATMVLMIGGGFIYDAIRTPANDHTTDLDLSRFGKMFSVLRDSKQFTGTELDRLERDLREAFARSHPGRSVANRIVLITAATGGTLGVIATSWLGLRSIDPMRNIDLYFSLIPPAFAGTGAQGIAPLLPFILVTIFAVTVVAFIGACLTLLLVPNRPRNAKKLAAADALVKLLGGFFTGTTTSLISLA